ncbi:DUF983 domain-containing protein [Yoonia sp. BS5-3]|uniref:DUF983 domain-containing protein n=1 Tax=Yoonia phaeophyticola TaxID=3137369 RepID=A0ABZ2V8W1_9RHOB
MSDLTAQMPDRPARPAMINGLKCRCPKCGEAPLYSGFLKVTHTCPNCHEELHHHRADDGPAYLTILIVAHIVGFAMHIMWVAIRPDPLMMALVITFGAVGLSLLMLPRVKGLIVAIQWARRMHGFGHTAHQ